MSAHVTAVRFEGCRVREKPWSRTKAQGVAPKSTESIPSQPVESSTPRPASVSHLEASSAHEGDAYTAGALRTSALPAALPSFLEACADLVAQAVMRGNFDRARDLIEHAERASAATGGTAA
jgi:hypothetical protein